MKFRYIFAAFSMAFAFMTTARADLASTVYVNDYVNNIVDALSLRVTTVEGDLISKSATTAQTIASALTIGGAATFSDDVTFGADHTATFNGTAAFNEDVTFAAEKTVSFGGTTTVTTPETPNTEDEETES